jgi:hypothetical protein
MKATHDANASVKRIAPARVRWKAVPRPRVKRVKTMAVRIEPISATAPTVPKRAYKPFVVVATQSCASKWKTPGGSSSRCAKDSPALKAVKIMVTKRHDLSNIITPA